jgi:7-carboxy-7-deazaguanine synthase
VTKTLGITEIFYSIQGESTHAGRPCVFVRLSGCPLRCSWCDTEYSFTAGKKMNFEEILAEIKRFGCDLVEVTGGEPLAQIGAYEFLDFLLQNKLEVLLETAGSHSLENVPKEVCIVMDIKAPGSNEVSRNRLENLKFLKPHKDEIKFVIADRTDFDFAVETILKNDLLGNFELLFSAVHKTPKHPGLDMASLAAWILESKLPVRMQTQLHKHIWGAEKMGV